MPKNKVFGQAGGGDESKINVVKKQKRGLTYVG